jgi:aminoglycoside phosphotransferase (APT) family kinase protein
MRSPKRSSIDYGEMDNPDPRCLPLAEIEFDQIQVLLSSALNGAAIASAERVEGGLVNTLYRVIPAGGGPSLCLRVFASGELAWETERKILARVSESLPVPEILLAGRGDSDFPYPYLVYRWIEGITLDDYRRQAPPAAFLSLAEPLGRTLAGIASFSFVVANDSASNAVRPMPPQIEELLLVNEEMLLRGLAGKRLGAELADAMWRLLEASAVSLDALNRDAHLVHGDLGGRNILVAPTGNDGWQVCGLIDWEFAFSGSALWDVGRLFRYSRRYSETFRQRFERGYRDAGGALPEDWFRTARLLDSTLLVTILNEEKELPLVFAECRELMEAMVARGT